MKVACIIVIVIVIIVVVIRKWRSLQAINEVLVLKDIMLSFAFKLMVYVVARKKY